MKKSSVLSPQFRILVDSFQFRIEVNSAPGNGNPKAKGYKLRTENWELVFHLAILPMAHSTTRGKS